MYLLKKILLKVMLLILVFIVINYIYVGKRFELDLQKYSPVINKLRSIPEDTEILYFAESSNNAYHEDDIDKRAISNFIDELLPRKKVFDITKPASHAGIYKVLMKNIPSKTQIKTVVVTVNLRSFNAQWIYSDLETALQKSLVLLGEYPPLIKRILLSFKGYDIKSNLERESQFKAKWLRDKLEISNEFRFSNVSEWDKYMAKTGIMDADGQYNSSLTELACHYIKGYGFQIDLKNNPRINDFNEIISFAHKRKWRLIFNILPENTERAKELVGDDLIFLMERNTKLISEYFQDKGVLVINNLNLLPNDQFIEQNWTTEHYKEKGRKKIASEISKAIFLNNF